MSRQTIAIPNPRTISVFITSLNIRHVEFVRSWYLDNPTEDGSLVHVWSGTHSGVELTTSQDATIVRDASLEALCEIFLLSFTDTLLTSNMSTFGYVAAGLSGIAPFQVDNQRSSQRVENADKPKCTRARTSEACHLCPPCRSTCVAESSMLTQCPEWQWGILLLTTPLEGTQSSPANTSPYSSVKGGCSYLVH